ncbi:hypothetical protein QYF36_006922 [Acer negundo]|nr:hypothetical protein QYF36_006922 [Acer negundo]
MANETMAETQSIVDPYKAIHVKPNPDGSITRSNNWPKTPATPDPPHHIQVLSKDVVINQSNNVWVRIFLPREALDQSSSSKLPLIVYYHGGGFVICSADLVNFHNFCFDIAEKLQAVVVSVEYRLAPENRLPAAYDDAMEALHWIRDTKDEWLTKYVDFSKCFLMGSSAGGNIAYHAGLRGALEVDNLLPIKIQVGADRNHEYSNPTVEDGTLRVLDQIKRLGWQVMVTGCDGDPLIDRQIEVVKLMEEKGVKVMSHFALGGFHGVEFTDPSRAEAVISQVKDFVFSSN